MVYNKEIISTVSSYLKKYEAPIVLDPVLAAGTGAKLLGHLAGRSDGMHARGRGLLGGERRRRLRDPR